ncbi:MAG: peptidoglycan DD-metalloendopeptidase family protein [Anaerolineae bacterium]|nr:peptidoglycan DD-metalloendopeptidase family protein [Anaerolineae bacterium]
MRQTRYSGSLLLFLAIMILLAAPVGRAEAQAQCGYVDGLEFPVDTSLFSIVQDYAAPSARWQGRFHSGEDWFIDRNLASAAARGTAYGEYVRAIANGRVVFSDPRAWGFDGGVIVLEHVFPDNSVAYSMYGHITDETGVAFPAVYTCVRRGDILAAVADVRPVPHLHFEIRAATNTTPGAGYVWLDPEELGYRRPSKFISNWQTWLQDAYRWRVDLADELGPAAAPAQLEDYSLVYLDAAGGVDRLVRATPDGRVLWRVLLNKDGVGVVPEQEGVYLFYADGEVQFVARDGTPGEKWSLGEAIQGAPTAAFGLQLFRTPDDQLIAVDTVERRVIWRLDDVLRIVRSAAGDETLALVTEAPDGSAELLTIGANGALLDRAYLNTPGALAVDGQGGLHALTQGGLWRIDRDGQWSLSTIPVVGNRNTALAIGTDGAQYIFDGATLTAYNAENVGLWQSTLPRQIEGTNQLTLADGLILLTNSEGEMIAWQAASGALCGQARIWGDSRTNLWSSLDDDGTLRVWVGDQIIGFNWREFTALCR